MTILITGISGCIGQTLAARLLAKQYAVVGMDINIDGNRLDIPVQDADITQYDQVQRVVATVKPQKIVHCARIMEAKTDTLLHQVNAVGTQNLCQAAAQQGVKRLVHLSSVAVVSGNSTQPLTDDMPYKAINSYGESKIAAEKQVLAWRQQGLPSAILRPAIVYGEREYRVLNPFLTAIQNRKLPILDIAEMESPLQLAYADNVADALELALTVENALEGTFLIADPEPITLRRLLEIAYQTLGIKIPVVPRWLAQRLMQNPNIKAKLMELFRPNYFDQSRALQRLGYHPSHPTEPSLKQTIRLWQTQPQAQRP